MPHQTNPMNLFLLSAVNKARETGSPNPTLEAKAQTLYACNNRLAVYGTLGPNRANHHQISDIKGNWSEDTVTGTFVQAGWGAGMGFPALVWSETGGDVRVQVLTSDCLSAYWGMIDKFEGAEYRRVLVPLGSGGVANIYVHADALSMPS